MLDADEDVNRWLFVEKARDEAKGGWATGAFDPARNKIEVRTRDVTRFGLFLDRVPIDWEKLVVLSIDGKNSELRRRPRDRLRLELDEHGQWTVIEP